MNLTEVLRKKDVVERELSALYEKNGKLTAEIVIQEAKQKTHPLHEFFTWDNKEAAINFRLEEARMMIRTVKITINTGVTNVTVRKYVNIRTTETDQVNPYGKKSEYTEIKDVLNDEEKKQMMFVQAVSELNAFRNKYHSLQIFERLFAEIDNIINSKMAS